MTSVQTSPPALEEIRRIVRQVCANRPVARVDLFGSMASGSVGPASDIDLLVEFLPDSSVGLFEMGELREDLAERLGRPVDLVSRRAIETSKNPFRRRAILRHCVNVYAR
jgi:uncharacterized protein